MKAEHLLVLASARGMPLDLRRPKRDIPFAHRTSPRRRDVVPSSEDQAGSVGIPGVLTAEGRQTQTSRAPEWTPTDLGFAAAEMPDRFWRTLCWAIGLEEQARRWLGSQLMLVAIDARDRGDWAPKVRRGRCATHVGPGIRCGAVRCDHGHYVEDLCELALIEIAWPHKFTADTERAEYFGVAPHTWSRQLSRPHAELMQHLHSWWGGAIGYLNHRLSERENERGAA